MKRSDVLKRGMRDVAAAMKQVAHETEKGGGSHINVTRRANIRVAKNVGRDGGTAFASATQHSAIVQDGADATAEGTDSGQSRKEQ